MNIDFNPDFLKAVEILEKTKKHLFLTGRAGTGKSTFLNYIRKNLAKNFVVLSPTGIAAVNIGGQTIHSVCNFAPNITIEKARKKGHSQRNSKLIKKLDMIIIDEISMVRSDLLDFLDNYLRAAKQEIAPFGGIQMVFIGDLYQLPPVLKKDEYEVFYENYKTPYFFSANSFKYILENFYENLIFIELQTIHRQKDPYFIGLLNQVRDGLTDYELIQNLNQRCNQKWQELPKEYIVLTTTNNSANQINEKNLDDLPGQEFLYEGQIEGNFKERDLPTNLDLYLKIGARVMFIKNDPAGKWVNGSLGFVEEVQESFVTVKLDSGQKVMVDEVSWDLYKTVLNEKTGNLEQKSEGSFHQLPLKLAWAITIHKSQGQTFDKVILNLENGAFASGQVYVAFSRCTTLEGLFLAKKVRSFDIQTDGRIKLFFDFVKKLDKLKNG